ncbi:MAG: hypothetical protein AB8B55_21565 [Mariniblastus sp.]
MTGNLPRHIVHEDKDKFSSDDQSILKNIEAIEFAQNSRRSRYLASNTIADQFIVWIPSWRFAEAAKSVAIASSRLSQKLDELNEWFDALRTLAVQLQGTNKFLVTASGTSTDTFINRVSEIFQIPTLALKPFPKSPTQKWFRETAAEQGSSLQTFGYYKLRDDVPKNSTNVNELVIASADSCFLLSVRNKGNILAAAKRRLELNSTPGSTRLLINRSFTPKSVEKVLLESGATAWWLFDKTPAHEHQSLAVQISKTPLLSLDEVKTENYLLHWTRRRVGPWPDQTQPEFIDDLIFQTTRRNHGEISALCRILAARRIFGSSELTRDRRPVVCFADLPLEQLPSKRVFRPHLSRWDFELFGIAIERELLVELNAKQVIYAEEKDWESLPSEKRPFFQRRQTSSEKIDWQSENEWRLIGDLNLELVPHDRAVVFVRTISDAHKVAELSHWPVVAIEE